MELFKMNLQLFGEGGDGGDGGDGGTASGTVADTGEDEALARIPERARKNYKKALDANRVQPATEAKPVAEKPAHVAYTDLIKSEEYKEEHKAYMDKTISDRLKKYKGIEEQNAKMNEALANVAVKYGLDANSETYLDDLVAKINSDDSYIEDYAMDHNLSNDEARRSIEMQRKIETYERNQAMQEQQAKQQEAINQLLASAERTKAVYPNFDLDAEMQNEQFRNLCAVTHGDTLAAYRTVHHDEILKAQGLAVAQRATQQIANSVAANQSRPIENGMSSQASAVTTTDFSRMNLQQIRAYAEEQRRKMR